MNSIADYATRFIGIKEGSPDFKKIIDGYNKEIKPLPRSYKVKYNDNWCATFVSLVLKRCGCSINLYECSAQRMKEKFVKNKLLLSDIKAGQKDDIIFYDWNDNNWCDHVGIIARTTSKNYVVIEGNKNNAVGQRTIAKTDKSIAAIGKVGQSSNTLSQSDITKIAHDVIAGKYGTGTARKKALGQNYDIVQKEVNRLLKLK